MRRRLLAVAFGASLLGCSSIPREWTKACALSGHRQNTFGLAISADKRLVATASSDGTVRVWDRATGKNLRVLRIDKISLDEVAFLAGGDLVAAVGYDRWVAWSTKTWEVTADIPCSPRSMAVQPEGPLAVVGTKSGNLLLINAATGTSLARRKVSPDPVYVLTASSDFKTLVCRADAIIRVDLPGLEIQWRGYDHNLKLMISRIIVEPQFGIAITASYDDTARIWDLSTGKCTAVLQHETSVTGGASLSADGRRLLTISNTKALVWSTSTWQQERVLDLKDTGIHQAHLSKDGSWAVLGDGMGRIWTWDLRTEQKPAAVQARDQLIGKMIFDEDEQFVVLGGWGGDCPVWNYR